MKEVDMDGGRDVIEKATAAINRQAEDSKLVARSLLKLEDLISTVKNFERCVTEKLDCMEEKVVHLEEKTDKVEDYALETRNVMREIFESGDESTQATATATATATVAPENNNNNNKSTTTATSSSSTKKKKQTKLPIKGKKGEGDDLLEFNDVAPQLMAVTSFITKCYIYNINLEAQKPFSFKCEGQPKCRLLKLWRYFHKFLGIENIEAKTKLKNMKVNGKIHVSKHAELRDLIQKYSNLFIKKIYADFHVIQPPKLDKRGQVKPLSTMIAQNSQVGTVVTKIEKLENKMKHQNRFYVYVY